MLKKLAVISLGLILIISCGGPEKDASGYWESAKALADVGNFEGAIEQYNKIMKYYPSDSLASDALLRVCEINRSKLNNYNKSIQLYQKFIDKYPNNSDTPNAMFMIGYVYANYLEDYPKAKEAYQKFIDNYPEHDLVASAEWELKNMGKDIQKVVQNKEIVE